MAESKFTSRKRRAPHTVWMQNALRSVGYSAKEAFVSLTPITSKTVKSASSSISDRLSNAGKGDLKNAISNNKYLGVAKRTIDRAIDDLKTGNFYNKEREEKLQAAMAGMEDLFDDNLWDDEGGEVDFAYVDQRDDGVSETTAQASFYVADTVKAGTEATLKASRANLDAMAAMSNATIAEIKQLGGQVSDKLTSIDNTLTSILQYHEQNTSNFYETVIASLEKFGRGVEEEKDDPYSYGDRKLNTEDLFSDKAFNFEKYGKYVKQHFSNYLNSSTAGALLPFLSDEKQLESALANPIGMITESIVSKMIPNTIKTTLGEFDKTLEDFVPSVLARLSNLKNDTYDFKGNLKETIGKIFGADPNVGRTFDLQNQGRGAATFDKVTRNAITHVLPKYARESTAYLRAIAEHFKIDTKTVEASSEVYDYENGEFVTKKNLRQNLAKGLLAQQTAGYRGTDMYSTVRAGGADLYGKAAERYDKMVDQMFAYITQANKSLTAADFDVNKKDSYVNLLLSDLEGHTRADKKAKKVLRQALGIMKDEDMDLAEIARAQMRGKADYRSYIQMMAENADEYNLRDAGFTSETDIFDFIDNELGFNQRKRNKAKREKQRKKETELNPKEKAKEKATEIAKNARSAKEIAMSGFKNTMRLDENGHNREKFQNYEADGIISAAANAVGHTKNAMSLFIRGADANSIMDEFAAIFSDSIKGLFKSFKESFIDPSVKAIFGEKNADGFREGGLLAGAQNKIKDTWHAINLRITGKGYVDSEGNEHTTESDGVRSASAIVKDVMSDIGEGIRFKLFGDKDKKKDKDGKEKSGLVGNIIDSMKEGVVSWKNALFGTNDKDVKSAVDDVKKKALDAMPNATVGALGGAVVGHISGGLLGSLIAGPVAPLIGLATGLATKSKKFQRYVFGAEIEDEEGNKKRVGGLISQKTQEMLKDPATKKALIGGAALGLLKAKIFGSSGGVLGMLVGGPVAGALLGMGTSMLVRSKSFQTFLFGDEESGKTGFITHFKNAWGKFGKGDKDTDGGKSGLGTTLLGVAGLGIGGAAIGKMIANHGVLGASLSSAGPIGGAILGTALAIKLGGKRFQNLLFGEKDEETGKRKGGLVTKLANWMHVEVIAPMRTTMLDTARYIKDEIEFELLEPLRISIEPLAKAISGGVKKFTDKGKAVLGDVGDKVKKKLIEPFLTVVGKLFAPIRTAASIVTKVAVKASLAVVTFPVKIMHGMAEIIMNPFVQLGKVIKEKIIKPIKSFAKNVLLDTLKLVGGLMLKGISMPVAAAVYGGNKIADRWAGLGKTLGEHRYTDKGTYGSEHARWRKERRDRKNERKQQRREEKNLDRNRRLAARFRGYNIGKFTEDERNKIDEEIKMWNKTHKFTERKQKIKWYGGKNITYEKDPEVEAKKESDRKKAKLANMDNEALVTHDGKNEADLEVRQLSEQTKIRVGLERLAEFFIGKNPIKAKREEILKKRMEKEKEKAEKTKDAEVDDTEETEDTTDDRDTVEKLVDEFDQAGGIGNWFKSKIFKKRSKTSEPDSDDNEADETSDFSITGAWNKIKNKFGLHKRAKGGPIKEGEPTLVGDGGTDPSAAEIIVPKTSGQVLSQSNGGIRVQVDGISRSVMKSLANIFRREFNTPGGFGNSNTTKPSSVLAGFSEEGTEEIIDSWNGYDDDVRKSIQRYAKKQKKKGAEGIDAIGTKEENDKKNMLKEAALAAKEKEKEKKGTALAEIKKKGSYESQLAVKTVAKDKEAQMTLLQNIATNTKETATHSKHHLLKSITHFGEWASMFGKTGKLAMGILLAIPVIKAAWPVLEGIWNWLKDLDIPGAIKNAFSKFFKDKQKHSNKNGKSGTETTKDKMGDYANAITNPSAETIGNVILNDKNEVKGDFVSTVRGTRGFVRHGKNKLQHTAEKVPFLGKKLKDKRKAKEKARFKEGLDAHKSMWKRATGNAKNTFGNVEKHSKKWFTNLYGEEEGAVRFADWQEDKLKYADNIEKGMTEKEAKKQFRKDQKIRNSNRREIIENSHNPAEKKNRLRDKIKDKANAKLQDVKGRTKAKASELVSNAKDRIMGPKAGDKGTLEYIMRKEGYKKTDIKSAVNMIDNATGMNAKAVAETMGMDASKVDDYIAAADTKRSSSVVAKLKSTKVGQKTTKALDGTKNVLGKFWDAFTKAIDKFFSFVSEKVLKKTGGKAAKEAVEKGAKKGLKSFLSKGKAALAKGIGKIMKPAMAILGLSGAAAASGVGLPALLAKEGIFIAAEAINGLSNPRTLFMVPPDTDVDWIMNLIAGVIGGIKGTTVGSILDLAFSVMGPIMGCNCWNTIATIAYNLIANGIGDSDKYEELIKKQDALTNQYDNYKENETSKQYNAYLKANKLDKKKYSYDQFKKDINENKLDVHYDSFDEFNEGKNKTIGGHINTAFGGAVTNVKNYVKDIKGETVKGYLDKNRNLFFKESKDKYIVCNVTEYDKDGVPVSYKETDEFLPKKNLNTQGLQEIEFDKKGKGFFKATGSAIKGAVKSAGSAISSFGKKLWGGIKSIPGGAADLVTQAGKNATKTIETAVSFVKKGASTVAKGAAHAANSVIGFFVAKKDEIFRNPKTKTYWKSDGNGKFYEYNVNNQKMSDKSIDEGELSKMLREGILIRDELTVEESGLTKTVDAVKKGFNKFGATVSGFFKKTDSALQKGGKWIGERAHDIAKSVVSVTENAGNWLEKMGSTIWTNHDGSFYNEKGEYFTGSGERIKDRDISKEKLQNLISTGLVVKTKNWQLKLKNAAGKALGGIKDNLNKAWGTAKSVGASIATGALKLVETQKKVTDYVKKHGIGGTIKKFFIGGDNNNKYGFFTPDGKGYYIRNNNGTYNHYSMANDLLEENISGEDAERIDDNISRGVYKKEKVNDGSVISSAVKSVQKTVEDGWSKAKDSVSSAWKKFTGWLGGKGTNIELPESDDKKQSGGRGGLGGFGDVKEFINKKIKTMLGSTQKPQKSSVKIGGYGADEDNDHPYYSQKDSRWANKSYNGKDDRSDMGTAGCGPTAMAMVASKYSKRITPDKVAKDAINGGFRDETGTNSKFMDYEAQKLGIRSRSTTNPTAEEIYNSVKNGNSMILNGVSNGDPSSPYTKAGHYVVATGVDENGNIKINDPRGESYNNPVSPEYLANQTRAGWKFGEKKAKVTKAIKGVIGGLGKKKDKKNTKKVSLDPHKNEPTTTTGTKATFSKSTDSSTKKKAKKKANVSSGATGGKDWIGVVRSVHKAMSDETIANNYEYSSASHNIKVDGTTYSVRWDCSGFVSACLQVYGVKPKGWTTNASGFASKAANLDKFTFMAWPGWDNLQEGDIMARDGHTEIFAWNKGGKHYVYNAGSTKAIKATSPTSSSKDSYSAVWRPNNPGAGVTLVTGTTDGTTASISGDYSSGGMTVLDKINNLFDQYVTKATNGLLGGEWDTKYDLTFGQSGDSSSSGSTNSNSSSIGALNITGSNTAQKIWNAFKSAGYSDAATAGAMGNAYQESGLNPKLIQGNGKGPAAGLFQWENYNTKTSRWKAMADRAAKKGKKWTDLENQLEFTLTELESKDIDGRFKGKYGIINNGKSKTITDIDGESYTLNALPGGYAEFKTIDNVEEAVKSFEAAYERAGKPNFKRRIGAAKGYYEKYKGTGGGTESTSKKKESSKKKGSDTKAATKKKGGKGFGGFGESDVRVVEQKDVEKLVNNMTTVDDMIPAEVKSGGFGKGTKNVKVSKAGALRNTATPKKHGKIAAQQELQRNPSVEAEMKEMKKFMKDVVDLLQDIRGNTGEIAPAIKTISIPSGSQSTSSKPKKNTKVNQTKPSTPTGINDSKNARLAMQLAKGY